MKSQSEESTEKLLESLHAPHRKPEMAREKNPKKAEYAPEPEVSGEDERLNTKREQAVEFIKKTSEKMKDGVSLAAAFKLIIQNGKLFFASIGVILAMLVLSIFLYHQISSFVTVKTLSFFEIAPASDDLFSEIYHALKVFSAVLFKFVAGILLFYLSFVVSYALVSPLYSFVSTIAENLCFGKPKDDAELSLPGIIEDVRQAVKVTLAALALGIIAFFIGFIPVLGQLAAFIICFFINALLIFDFAASRRRWGFVQKVKWLLGHPAAAFRTALLPSLVSLIPVANTILTAFLFPVFIVHATMNFACAEREKETENTGEKIEG